MYPEHQTFCDQSHTPRQRCNDNLRTEDALEDEGVAQRAAVEAPDDGEDAHLAEDEAPDQGEDELPPDDEGSRPTRVANFCRRCGAQKIGADSNFCDNCGASFGTAPPRAVAANPAPEPSRFDSPSRVRDGGNVAWGVLWGILFWPSIIIMMLGMPKGLKREDRVFGYWLGLAGSFAVGFIIGLAAVLASPSDNSLLPVSGAATSDAPQLLRPGEAISIASDSAKYSLGISAQFSYRCPTARYEPPDRKWVVTCEFRRSATDISPFQTKTFIVDDRTGKVLK